MTEVSETDDNFLKEKQKKKPMKIIEKDLVQKLTNEKNKTHKYSQNYNQGNKYNSKSNKNKNTNNNLGVDQGHRNDIVPKTLGLRNSAQKVSKVSMGVPKSLGLKLNQTQEPSNKSDFKTMIASTLPQLHSQLSPTSPYKIKQNFPQDLEDQGRDDNIKSSSIIKIQEDITFSLEQNDSRKSSVTFDDSTNNLKQYSHHEKASFYQFKIIQTNFLEKPDNIVNNSYWNEKENKKKENNKGQWEETGNEMEDISKTSISIEVSQGGKILADSLDNYN